MTKVLKGLSNRSMNEEFDVDEVLLRAVYPRLKRPEYWENGHLSSAALKDSRGLSVDRSGSRSLYDSVEYAKKHLKGFIVSITVRACNQVEAELIYLPSGSNPFHSEIHGSKTEIELSDFQAFMLSRQARIEFQP